MFDGEVACWGGLFFIWGWGAEFVGWSICCVESLIYWIECSISFYLDEYKL